MNLVNELFQNIRFLKFYGWGSHSRFTFCDLQADNTLVDCRIPVV